MKTRVQSPPWTRDELILALDLYFRQRPSRLSPSHPEVKKLSNILNRLPLHTLERRDAKFRNENAVYMKLCQLIRFDPHYRRKGLPKGGRLEGEIWKEFSGNPKYLRKLALSIIQTMELKRVSEPATDGEEASFPEGKILYRQHRNFELNKKVAGKVKKNALISGNISCSACGFDFLETYGRAGQGYMECHHTKPLSEYRNRTKVMTRDMVLVCSNCHAMLHRRRPWLTKKTLPALVSKKQDLL